MRALVLTGPGQAEVREVHPPIAQPGGVVVDVRRVGVCGTDQELFAGDMPYFKTGRASYPLRPGHEWCGVVAEVGDGVDAAWLGARVMGDTMLACGQCDRCLSGRRHVCREIVEVGIAFGFHGALAEQVHVPVTSLRRLPDAVDDEAGALVEPGGNAWRAAAAVHPGPGRRVLVFGTGTVGLLAAAFVRAAGAEVHVVGRRPGPLELALAMGADGAWKTDEIPDLPFHGVIDATNAPEMPAAAVARAEPGGRVAFIGLAGAPSMIDTRLLAFHDVTAVGLLSGSPGLGPTIEAYAAGTVDPHPLIEETVGLEGAIDVLAGRRPAARPKTLVDPSA